MRANSSCKAVPRAPIPAGGVRAGAHGPSSTAGCPSWAGMGAHVHPCKPVCTHIRTCTPVYTHTHTRAVPGRPRGAPPRTHVHTMCGAHGRAERLPSIPAGGSGTSPACRMLRGAEAAACAACQRGNRASSTARVPPPAAAFWRCKFGKLLTKLFGLNQLRPNESYRGEGLRGPFAPPRSFPALQPSGFYCTSPVPCAPEHRKWERSPSRAVTPQCFPCIRLQLRVQEGMRGRGHIIKAALGNPTRLREQLRYQ